MIDVIFFLIMMLVSLVCFLVIKKMELPYAWLRIGWILLMDILGVILLVSRLSA